MDVVSLFTDPKVHSYILQGLIVASAALPLLEKLASLTATKKDDDAVKAFAGFLEKLLSVFPRVRLGEKK